MFTAVYYQTLPPAFLNDMSTFSSPEINSFMTMYANADKSPVKVAADTLLNIPTGIHNVISESLKITPNPTSDGRIIISDLKSPLVTVELWDQRGKRIQNFSENAFGQKYGKFSYPK
ncbi:MAG: hypothetical protein R2847_11795 [Bacteroidia bacterium]